MAIKIDRIEVEQLGPLSSFKNDLRDVTLIYGHNEKGKTFLVEFILKSLFKSSSEFKNEFRIKKPGGKVIVTGLESEPVTFSPGSPKKLETRWEENNQEIPSNMARLLVVKGGETSLEKTMEKTISGGISPKIIREFLSDQAMLDAIQKEIRQVSTKNATIEAGEIYGLDTGDLGKRNEYRNDLINIDGLLESINGELADGDIITLDKNIKAIDERMNLLETAKKHSAYCIDQKKKDADAEIQRFEKAQIELIDRNFYDYKRKQDELARKKERRNEEYQRGIHYEWLDTTLKNYQNELGRTTTTRRPAFLVIPFILLLVTVLFIIFEQRWLALASTVLFFGTWLWYFLIVNKMQANQGSILELDRIRSSYQEKFNETCKDISTMQVKLKEITRHFNAVQTIDEEIKGEEDFIKNLSYDIQQGLKELTNKKIPIEKWEKTISAHKKELSDLQAKFQQYKEDLARLNVDRSDYIDSDPGIPYSRDIYDEIKTDRDRLIEDRTKLEKSLEKLKSEVQGFIQNHNLSDWSDIINKFREKRQEKVEAYKSKTTEVIAGNLLNKVIEKIRQQEDNKIIENLNSPIVLEPLKQISNHYVSLELDEGSINVIDEFNCSFSFNELSTGTREQILLALRMGFAKKIMQGNTAFLILDDAFQHSDWDRRVDLVDTTFALARQGWQVIYFSMDDHLRDLFDSRGKKMPKSYVRIDID